MTPLHRAASRGLESVCKLLLRRGADHRLKNSEGDTPLDLAISNHRTAVVQLLESWAANPQPAAVAVTSRSALAHEATGATGARSAPPNPTAAKKTARKKSSAPIASPVPKMIPYLEELFAQIELGESEKAKYKALFIEHDITSPDIVADLDSDKLKAIGVISVGHQIKFERFIKALRNEPPRVVPFAEVIE